MDDTGRRAGLYMITRGTRVGWSVSGVSLLVSASGFRYIGRFDCDERHKTTLWRDWMDVDQDGVWIKCDSGSPMLRQSRYIWNLDKFALC